MAHGIPPPTDVLLKLLLVGDMGVGKSSILLRYTDNDFSTTYISTIGVDFKIKTVVVGDLRVKLQIWDTAGQDRFRSITSTYYRGTHGVLIVYDVNDVRSFYNVEKWLEEVNNHTHELVARILVGNKNEDPQLKTVATQDAQRLAARHSCLFIESSAKSDDNIDQLFDMITREALRLKPMTANAQMTNTLTLQPVDPATNRSKSKCCIGGGGSR